MVSPDNPIPPPALNKGDLLVFVLDGSGSMTQGTTHDGRAKTDHVMDILSRGVGDLSVLGRLQRCAKAAGFRCAFVYFKGEAEIESDPEGIQYFNLEQAVQILRDPTTVNLTGATAIAKGLRAADSIIDRYSNDPGIPANNTATVFLLTDGLEETETPDDVRRAASELAAKVRPNMRISLATISFGDDADEDLLREIAGVPSDQQKQMLESAGVLQHLPDPDKLFLQGHVDGTATKEKVEAIRTFVDTVSQSSPG